MGYLSSLPPGINNAGSHPVILIREEQKKKSGRNETWRVYVYKGEVYDFDDDKILSPTPISCAETTIKPIVGCFPEKC